MLAPEFLPVWGGVGTYIVELIRHMPSSVEVHVVTPFRERIGQNRISSSEYDLSKYFGSNVHFHFISRASDTFFYNAFFQYAVARCVPRLVEEEKIDLIHSHMAHMPDLLLLLKSLKVPVVTTIHTTIRGQMKGTKNSGMGFSGLAFSEKMTFLSYPFLRFAEDLYFLKDRCYITVSRWMKEQILKNYPRLSKQKVFIIHNAVNTELFSPVYSNRNHNIINDDRNAILFVGRLMALKGFNVLIRAAVKVLKERKDVVFLFLGSGDPTPYLKKVDRKILESNSMFLGYVSYTDIAKYYRRADIFVLPSFSENLPMTLLEAMASGVPVIASKVGGIPEAVENYKEGILIPPGFVNDLADSILHLIENPDLRRRMGRNAREKVDKEFSWTTAIRKILKVYEHLSGEA